MRSKSSLVVGLGAFLTLTLGFAWYHLNAARQASVALRLLNESLDQQSMRVQQVEEKATARQREVAALQVKLKRTATATAVPKGPARVPIKDLDVLMESDSILRASHLKVFRLSTVPAAYRLMYLRLGLTPAQIDKFEELAVTREDDLITLRAAAKTQGFKLPEKPGGPSGGPNAAFDTGIAANQVNPGLAALLKESDEQFYSTVAREMGADVGDALAQNGRMADVQAFVVDLDARRATGALALSNEQATQMAQILLEASATYQKGGAATLDAMNWDGVYSRASAVLSGTQLQVLKARADFYRLGNIVRQYRSQPKAAEP